MLRKFLLTLALALVGLFAVAGVASAAPTPYPITPAPPGVTVNQTIIVNGGVVIFAGGGFTPGETINITIIYNAPPSGLRANAALKLAANAAESQTTTADASGNFSSNVKLTQTGTATITATGLTSGKTSSLTVTVVAQGGNTATETTTVAGDTATDAGPVAAGGNDTGAGGLASTGASIAGPLAVGGSALVAGLALLFFGSRLVIRRRSSPSSH